MRSVMGAVALGVGGAILLLSGCGVDLLVSTGIVTSLESQDAKTALKVNQFANTQMALTTVQQAVSSFKAGEGRNPTSLQEVVNSGYLASIPEAPAGQVVYYDPATGNVDFRSPPDVPPAPVSTPAPPVYQPQKGYAQPQPFRPGQPPVPAHGPVAPANPGVRAAPVQQPQPPAPPPAYQGNYTPRGRINATTQNYNQQQQKAVDDLVGR